MNAENIAPEFPETLNDAMQFFASEDNAFAFTVALRWRDGVCCPTCGSTRVNFISSRRTWECREKHERRQFSVKVGTIFEDSPIKLGKWWCATWLISNAKNGISSCELHRALGVTQKTAWFMLHRIRLALQNGSIAKVNGTVEVDETYIGGKARLMNAKARARRKITTSTSHLAPVQGLLQRSTRQQASRVILKHVKSIKTPELQGNILEHVEKGAEVHTDEATAYHSLPEDFAHKVINHAVCYAKDNVHINGLENFWSLLKRAIRGTYVSVEPFHLFRYLDEQAFRFNERKDNDMGRFLKAATGIFGKGLRYAALIGRGKEGETSAGSWQTA